MESIAIVRINDTEKGVVSLTSRLYVTQTEVIRKP